MLLPFHTSPEWVEKLERSLSPVFSGATFVTTAITLVAICIYILQLVLGLEIATFCLSLSGVIHHYEVYLLLSSPIFHDGFWHLVFNLVALVGIGIVVENRKGSVLLGLICLACLICSEILYLLVETVLLLFQSSMGVPSTLFTPSCVIGLSGLVFSLFVIDCLQISVRTIQIFDRFTIKSLWLPWIVLLVIQVLIPNASFIGHLCGIVAGYIYVLDGFHWLFPSCHTLHAMEERFRWISHLPGFVFHRDICCSASQTRSSSLFAYRTLCPQSLSNWLPWKQKSPEQDSRFPGKGYRLIDDASVRLISNSTIISVKKDNEEQQVKPTQSVDTNETLSYGSASSEETRIDNSTQTETNQ